MSRAARQGLVELLLVSAVLALGAAGAAALFGDEIRAAFGAPPPRPATAGPGAAR